MVETFLALTATGSAKTSDLRLMDFGRYSEFIFAAYAVSGATLAALTIHALRRLRRARARLPTPKSTDDV